MKRNILSLFFIVTGIPGINLQAAAQGLSGLNQGMEYFMFGSIAFIIVASLFVVYYLRLNINYQRASSVKYGQFAPQPGFYKWRKSSFYITTIVVIISILSFQFFNLTSKKMKSGTKVEKGKQDEAKTIDENTIALADANGIAEGKKIFTGTCFPCHGANGEGNAVGPNLTDNYWLHGGSIKDVYKTITNGVPDKGMQSWGNTYSSTDIRNLSSFIMSLKGTNPPNAKAPQGNLYEDGKKSADTVLRSARLAP